MNFERDDINDLGAPVCPPALFPGGTQQWIPLTPVERMAETEYDVLIVGSGAGGGAVLWRIANEWGNNGKKIGVVEAGDLFLPTHAWNLPTLNSPRTYQLGQNISVPIGKMLPEFPGAFNKIVFGGGTLFWGNVSPRMLKSVIRTWPVSFKEMDYYYSAAEWIMNVNRDYGKGSSLSENLLGRLHRQGFTEAGGVPMSVDLEQTKYGQVHSNVFFSSLIFFAYAFNRRPVDLAVKARVVQVLHNGGKVAGVEVMTPDKKRFAIKARKVVLSASTLETPRILLYSGIQNSALGHYISDHASVTAVGVMNRNEFPEVLGTLSVMVPETEKRPYQVQLLGPGQSSKYYVYKYEQEPLMKEFDITLYGTAKLDSRYDNFLTLDPNRKDEFGVPMILVHYSYNEQDKHSIRQSVGLVRQIAKVIGAPLSDICIMAPGQAHHAIGTCRIGTDPLTAAADPYGEIFGVSGLFVADNSMIPSMSAANPTLSTIALSIRTADQIIRQIGK